MRCAIGLLRIMARALIRKKQASRLKWRDALHRTWRFLICVQETSLYNASIPDVSCSGINSAELARESILIWPIGIRIG